MDTRERELLQLKQYSESIDNELTMILQSLQWDRNKLLEGPDMVTCKCDSNHRLPTKTVQEHEVNCSLRRQGYVIEDQLLPEPLDLNANTLIKLRSQDINSIIENVSRSDPLFRKGGRSHGALSTPQSLARLYCTYTPDERRAIHDAVVAAAPSCHDLADLALLTAKGEGSEGKRAKSRVEILAELRDERRRRTRYRGAPNKNYSHELRELINAQMEVFTGTPPETKPTVAPIDIRSNDIIHRNIKIENRYESSQKSYTEKGNCHKYERSRRESKHDVSSEKRVSRESSAYREEKNRYSQSREKEPYRKRRYDDHNRRDSKHVRSKYDKDESRSTRREEKRPDISYGHKYEDYAEKQRRDEKYTRCYDREDYPHERKKLKK